MCHVYNIYFVLPFPLLFVCLTVFCLFCSGLVEACGEGTCQYPLKVCLRSRQPQLVSAYVLNVIRYVSYPRPVSCV
jgi:hypothetical protein